MQKAESAANPNGNALDQSILQNFQKELEDSHKLSFNILDFSRMIRREKVLPVLTLKFMNDLGLTRVVNQPKLNKFLDKVQKTYDTRITYHNDLHGTDVM